jgi:predicted permease
MMLVVPLCLNSLVLISLLQETPTNFDDLGTLLLGGVAAAIVLAVGFTLVRFRLRDKKPQTSGFISISSDKE